MAAGCGRSVASAGIISRVRYRAVLFDLDDTLIPEQPAIEAGFAAVAQRVWGSSSTQRVRSLWDAAGQVLRDQAPTQAYLAAVHITAGDLLHGSLVAGGRHADSLRAFLRYYLEHAFDPVLPESARPLTRELVDLWRETRLAALSAYPETASVLDWLSRKARLALVTNGLSKLQRDKLERTGLSGYFASVVVAEEVGAAKPDAAMFHETLRRLELCANEAVMVGNDLERDIAGARSAGLATIHITRADGAGARGSIANLRELGARLGFICASSDQFQAARVARGERARDVVGDHATDARIREQGCVLGRQEAPDDQGEARS
jgi:putative hydrolase of the HAD superfamily